MLADQPVGVMIEFGDHLRIGEVFGCIAMLTTGSP
jgi:hypothetical protein